jgi:peptidoglycan endopeptidase LytE
VAPRSTAHVLVLAIALSVAGTATYTPAQRAVSRVLVQISIEEAATGEAPFMRPAPEVEDTPYFPPPDPETLAALRPRPSIVTHVVRQGDTVSKLAERYRVTANTIVWANNLANPDRLPLGEAILILPMSGILHHVRSGDTVESIAGKYQIDAQAVADANGIALGKHLLSTDQLVVPGARPLEPERPEPTTRAVDRSEPSARPAAGAPARTEPTPPQPLRPIHYDVVEGDTIVSIARRFGVSTATIALANGITGSAADSIKVGQKLLVPPIDGILHRVGEGESIRDLAARYGSDTLAIIKTNAITEPHLLKLGQELLIPGGKIPNEPPTAPAEPTPAPYTVADGDTLVRIAERFGLEPRIVARFNGLERSELISPGQSLLIPVGAARAPVAGSALSRSEPAPAPPPAAAPGQSTLRSVVNAITRPVAPAPPSPPPRPVVPTESWGIVGAASKFLGYSYVWGGHSPRIGFDCTGFTWYVFGQIGRSIPNHDLWGQMQSGPRVSRANLQAGDLVFFTNTYTVGLSHVGIYIGGGRFIHAGSERTGVTVNSLSEAFWGSRYYGATRAL